MIIFLDLNYLVCLWEKGTRLFVYHHESRRPRACDPSQARVIRRALSSPHNPFLPFLLPPTPSCVTEMPKLEFFSVYVRPRPLLFACPRTPLYQDQKFLSEAWTTTTTGFTSSSWRGRMQQSTAMRIPTTGARDLRLSSTCYHHLHHHPLSSFLRRHSVSSPCSRLSFTPFSHTHTRFRCGLFLFIFRYHDDQKPPDCVQSRPDHGLGHGLSVFSAFDYPVCSASCPRKCRRMSKSPRLKVVATGRRGSPCLERTRGLILFIFAISQNGQNEELDALSSFCMIGEQIIAS